MIILTILNTLAIAILFYMRSDFYIEIRKDKTFLENTFVAYQITLWKKTSEHSSTGIYTLRIPFKNKENVEREEEINRMIATYSKQQKTQALTAKFSWLKTLEEVKEFEKHYSIVDREIVESLVRGFKQEQ